MLKFNDAWRFDSPGPIPPGVVHSFSDLIGKIVSQGDRHRLLEYFKAYFAEAAGFTSNWSSSASWAETDLDNYMRRAAENAPLFIEAFYDACEALHPSGIGLPNLNRINRVLLENDAGYEIGHFYQRSLTACRSGLNWFRHRIFFDGASPPLRSLPPATAFCGYAAAVRRRNNSRLML
jgi:hypothetical protein